MPKKIRELIESLKPAGFKERSGKSSHRRLTHPLAESLTLSGNPGADAKHYQEKQVNEAINEAKNAKKR